MRLIWIAGALLLAAACGNNTTSASPSESSSAGPSASPSGSLSVSVVTPTVTPEPVESSVEPEEPTGTPTSSPQSTSKLPFPHGNPSLAVPKGPTAKPHKMAWISATPSKDGTVLRLEWWSGVEPCHVLDHVEVKEAAKTVTVTIYEGADPKSPDAVCVDVAMKKYTDVRLPKPLNGRKVIDGAKKKAK